MVECLTPEPEDGGFETHPRRVVSLSKTLYSKEVLVIPSKQWLRPDRTEKLLNGTLNINTNKQNHYGSLLLSSETD